MAPQLVSKGKAANAVKKQLARYRAMRDFKITPEPSGTDGVKNGKKAAAKVLPFVVQKHAATRLHYDFRLGWRGVLKSWAVTKGPSYVPSDKRLAVQVEDHPMEYGGFEGTIPKGQYGGGTVMVWDFGDWTPLDDADRGLDGGHLKFDLHGKKLKGRWALVRMHGHGERPGKPNWLLIKDRDRFARAAGDPAITEEAPNSALTHRTIDQIAKSADHVWDSNHVVENGASQSPRKQINGKPASLRLISKTDRPKNRKAAQGAAMQAPHAHKAGLVLLNSAPRERFPGFIDPQLAQQATAAPDGSAWVHELKLDGYRIQAHLRSHGKSGGQAKLLTRKGLDWTARMPAIARAVARLPTESAILDGEVVALNREGIPCFADLQAAFQDGNERTLTYFAFDLIHQDGHNLRGLPLLERKKLLASLLAEAGRAEIGSDAPIRLSEHFEAEGRDVFANACRLGAEGIVSKLASAKYLPGRGSGWLKVKCIQEQELVIGGFTAPSKGGHGIGALLLGYYEDGKLIYAGRSGTGFTQQTHRLLRAKLNSLLQKSPPFDEVPRDARRDAHWVKPELVAEIAFTTWTRDDLVRQAAFKGLREDKPAREVVREKPVPLNKIRTNQANLDQMNDEMNATVAAPRKSSAAKTAGSHAPAAQARQKKQASKIPIALTHPDKVLDEESGMTKQALADYLQAVAARMLPEVADRPLSVVRCPDGSGKPCFFQKHVGRGMPPGVNGVWIANRKTGVKEQYLTLNSAQGLVGLAQMGVLEIHAWGSRNHSLEKPDRLVFDLDPDAAPNSGIDWRTLAAGTESLRARLKEIGLESFLKSTGGKGLHIVVPIEPQHQWPVIKQFAYSVVLKMEQEQPELFVTKMSKSVRNGKIYLDYLRNDREATSIAPFSPRARPGAPVAVTLDWKELQQPVRPEFHVTDFAEWKSRLRRDPWKRMADMRQHLSVEAARG